MACTLEYFKSLVDPFEFGGLKLGWGCMVPTTAAQAFFRGTIAAATDGSLTIAVLPCVTDGILLYNSGLAVVGSTGISFSNASAITANCGEGRVVSVGIRAFPNIALTSVPGVSYSGATVATTVNQINTLATSDFVALPTSHQGIGTTGATSTGRPVDPESFVFKAPVVDALGWTNVTINSTRSLPFSVPYVSFVGLPTTTLMFVEVCLNIEATQVIAHASQTILPDEGISPARTVGDEWPVPEALHRLAAPFLPKPGRPNENAAAKDASFMTALIGTAGRAASAVAGIAGSAVGSFAANAGKTAAMELLGGGGTSGQRYSNNMRGYLQ